MISRDSGVDVALLEPVEPVPDVVGEVRFAELTIVDAIQTSVGLLSNNVADGLTKAGKLAWVSGAR